MSKIRVCLLVDTVAYDAGTERQVAETAKRLNPDRFEVHVCCLEASPQLDSLAGCAQVAVFPLPRLHSPNGLRQLLRFRNYLQQHQVDIVHTFMVNTSIFGVVTGRLAGCRTIITCRLNTGYWYTPFYLALFRFLNRFTTRIMVNSQGAREIVCAAEKLPLGKVDVIYQGVDMEAYAAQRGDPRVCESLGLPSQAKVVGMVANFRPVKDHALFLQAARLVAQAVPEAAFLLVGRGPLRDELQRLAGQLGLAGKVFFPDGRGQVVDHLARMSVGCLSSHSEGFANAILEYMAAGLPVVATDVGGNAEAIEEGVTGYLVRERTAEAFAAPIIRLLSDENLRRAMGRRGFERCAERFEIHKTIPLLEDYYVRLAGASETGR